MRLLNKPHHFLLAVLLVTLANYPQTQSELIFQQPVSSDRGCGSGNAAQPLTPQSMSSDENTQAACKRRKTVGGLRLSKHSPANAIADDIDISSESDIGAPTNCPKPGNGGSHHARQCHIGTRFPQRRNPAKDCAMPVVQPAPAEKLVSTIWRQLHSPIELTLPSPVCIYGYDPGMSMAN